MNPEIRATNMALTQISKQIDELYHRYGAYCGLSDPAIWVLYSLYEDEEKTYTQNDLVSMWFYPKQTVNYTVNSLVKNGWIYLEQLAEKQLANFEEELERIVSSKEKNPVNEIVWSSENSRS